MGYKEKLCEKCGRSYLPTGPRQRFCIDCRPKVADMADINALRSAIMKRAKKDGAIDRMVENGAAAQLFPGTDSEYIRRLAKEEKPLDGFTEYQPPGEEPDIWTGRSIALLPDDTGAPRVIIDGVQGLKKPEEKKEEEMKRNYRMVEPDDVWPALIEGQTVLAVDLAVQIVTNMQAIRVDQVNEYRQDPDVFFYVPIGKEADDGGEA